MCLPLGCLKFVVQFQAYLTLLMGLAAFGATIYLQVRLNDLFTFSSNTNLNVGHDLMIVLWIFDSVIVVLGIAGIVGGHKKICCLLGFFNIGNFVGFAVFLTLGVLAFVLGADISQDQVCSSTRTINDWSISLENTYTTGTGLLCQPNQCQCLIPATSTQSANPLLTNQSPTTGAENAQSCSAFPSSQVVNANFLDFLETTFDCSGWCNTVPMTYYVFSNVANPVPAGGLQSCQKQTIGWMSDNANLIGDVCMGIMLVMGLFATFTCCLCCHKDRPKDLNFYTRMAYYDTE